MTPSAFLISLPILLVRLVFNIIEASGFPLAFLSS